MAMGADQWNPKLWADLPEEARDELVALLLDIERSRARPEHILLNEIGMHPKPWGKETDPSREPKGSTGPGPG